MSNIKTNKKDILVQMQEEIQLFYKKNKPFDANLNNKLKEFITFPYPYMNGKLHLGHAYTISRAEFRARYKRLKEDINVLFPFGFHGSGMPIEASASKLKEELESLNHHITEEDINKMNYSKQCKILWHFGVQINEFVKFTDPQHWIKYFPTQAINDLKKFGASIDYRRSFITTDINPYYDKFIKWQFNKLNQQNKLKFGKKFVIYSPKDGQPCADHDRSVGEGIKVKEYILIKFNIEKLDIHLLVATTRPETLHGIKCLWINPLYTYIKFVIKNTKQILVCSENAIKNLKYQHDITVIERIKGHKLIDHQASINYDDLIVNVRVCMNEYVQDQGTGIIMSVPTHSLFDFKYFKNATDIIGCISVNRDPLYSYKYMNKHTKKSTSKELISKHILKIENKSGKLIHGKFAGQCTVRGRELIIKDLVKIGLGIKYGESEDTVISRTGDICIVALIDQWFIDYGDNKITQTINEYIKSSEFETYNSTVREQLLSTSKWLKEWPCTRSKGLGTKFLNTKKLIIDSLSDSTIYMAYYTISHLLRLIPHTLVNDELFDYIFLNKECKLSNKYRNIIEKMRQEFNYWYPVNVRVSGKDLVGNHLTMSLYNHYMIWDNIDYLPKSYFINGHVVLNGNKMSKSTGNFMLLSEALDKYGADAVRLALAEAGSSIEDANFTDENATRAILRLHKEKEWVENIVKTLNPQTVQKNTFFNQLFRNGINHCIKEATEHFEQGDYLKAVKHSFYGMMICRDNYRQIYRKCIIPIDHMTMIYYLDCFINMLEPICPHWSEWIRNYINKKGIKIRKQWPQIVPIDNKLKLTNGLIKTVLNQCRSKYIHLQKKNIKPSNLELKICHNYSKIELDVLKFITENINRTKNTKELIKTYLLNNQHNKKHIGNYYKFGGFVQWNVKEFGKDWLEWIKDISRFNIVKKWIPKLLDLDVTIIIKEVEPIPFKVDPTIFKTIYY